MQFANDEVITKTVIISGAWIDNMKITTSHREYRSFGHGSEGHTVTGSAMRYMGAGYSLDSAQYYVVRYVSGVKVYFICENEKSQPLPEIPQSNDQAFIP